MSVSHVGVMQEDHALGHDPEFTVTATPTLLLNPPTTRVKKAVVQVLDTDIIVRDDGGTPTGTQGQIWTAGDIFVYEGDWNSMRALTAITETGIARVRVAYYGI